MRPHKPHKLKKKKISLLEQKLFCTVCQLRGHHSPKPLKFPEQCGLTLVEKTTICENSFKPSFQLLLSSPCLLLLFNVGLVKTPIAYCL